MSLLRALARGFPYTATSHRLQIDRRRQRDQSFIRANVRRRFLAANVLLARRQRQHKTAPALLVGSFANQTAGNLARILVPRGEQSDVGAAERKWHAKRLSLSDHDVRAARSC